MRALPESRFTPSPWCEPDFIDRPLALMPEERTPRAAWRRARVRDEALLETALAMPRQIADTNPGRHYFAAAEGSSGNHPFVVGNKRTGFVTGVLFLKLKYRS